MLQYSYAYDDLGQLTRENNLPANRTYLYSYDKDGNMLSKTECSYTTSGTPSIIGVTSFTYGNGRSDVLKKITLPNGQTFTPTHDIVGNPSSVMIENGNTMAAMWSYGRRLTGLSSGSEAFSYSYNADGIRTTKTVNGVKHTYALSGTTILNEEWTENGVQHLLMYVYDANGSPTGMVYRNSTMAADATEEYLFVKNIQGDILYVYSSTGNKLVSYVYDAWGNIISTTYSNGGGTSAARFDPFTYRGYYRDSETGMYYLNSRYYNPKMGRFISADAYVSTGQGLLGFNMYAYCLNNPVMYFDAMGACAHQIIGDCDTCRILILSGLYDETDIEEIMIPSEEDDPFLASLALDIGLEITEHSLSKILLGSVRPANIGAGTYNKIINGQINQLSGICKAIGISSAVLFTGIDVAIGIDYNLKNHASAGKIVYDIGVDVAVSGGLSVASFAAGAAIGTACCPIVGTIVGVGISVVGYLIFDEWGLRNSIKDCVQ